MDDSMTLMKKNIRWNEQMEKVLRIIERQCNKYKINHSEIASYSEKMYTGLMISSIVLTPLSGIVTSLGSMICEDVQDMLYYNMTSTLLSFVAGILISVTKFSKFDKTGQAHSIALSRYTSLEQNIKRQLILDPKDRINAKEYLNWVIKNFDDLYTSSPILPHDELNKYGNFLDMYENAYDISIEMGVNSKVSIKKDSHDYENCKNTKCESCNLINTVNLKNIKKDKNETTYIFLNHQDLKKYDDENMKLEMKTN